MIKEIIKKSFVIICDICNEESKVFLSFLLNKREKYNLDICKKCSKSYALKLQYKNGRSSSFIKYNKNNTGKSYEERYGKEKSEKILKKMSINSWFNTCEAKEKAREIILKYNASCKGKSYEERYGKEKSEKIKRKISRPGELNSMYGKPSPKGSGNGWSGWYNGWYFRSLKELSFMINYIEANKLKWESAEKKKFCIEYIFNNKKRTYHPDFFIENKIYEIKPNRLHSSYIVNLKKQAAIEFCKKNNYEYILIGENDFKLLTNEEIKELYNKQLIKFIDRYDKKYKEKQWVKI